MLLPQFGPPEVGREHMRRGSVHQPVITGLGVVSPIGIGREAFWKNALAGSSGIGFLSHPGSEKLPRACQIAGEIKEFSTKEWMGGIAGRMAGRFSQFAVAASKLATDDASLQEAGIPPERIKVAMGSSMSGVV